MDASPYVHTTTFSTAATIISAEMLNFAQTSHFRNVFRQLNKLLASIKCGKLKQIMTITILLSKTIFKQKTN